MSNPTANTSRDWVGKKQQFARVVGSICFDAFEHVRSRIAANSRLAHRSRLDGCGVLNARRFNRTHCRYTGPFYVAMIAPTMVLGAASSP
jgi:hypothetical protein